MVSRWLSGELGVGDVVDDVETELVGDDTGVGDS